MNNVLFHYGDIPEKRDRRYILLGPVQNKKAGPSEI